MAWIWSEAYVFLFSSLSTWLTCLWLHLYLLVFVFHFLFFSVLSSAKLIVFVRLEQGILLMTKWAQCCREVRLCYCKWQNVLLISVVYTELEVLCYLEFCNGLKSSLNSKHRRSKSGVNMPRWFKRWYIYILMTGSFYTLQHINDTIYNQKQTNIKCFVVCMLFIFKALLQNYLC